MNNIAQTILNNKKYLMGLAIILIVIFHTEWECSSKIGYFLKNICDLGVDVFMLLSGFSLAYSWSNSEKDATPFVYQLYNFYKRRFVRILPSYILAFGAVYFYDDIIRNGLSWKDWLYDLCFLNFWIDGSIYIWFIPVILSFYLIIPFYLYFGNKFIIIKYLPYLIIAYDVCAMLFKLPMFPGFFWLRLPIFLIGANIFQNRNSESKNSTIFILGLSSILAMAACYYCLIVDNTMYGFKYLLYIPIIISIVSIFKVRTHYGQLFLAFMGSITLEIYLLHERIQWLADNFVHNSIALCAISVCTSVTIAFCLNRTINWFRTKIF